MSNYWAKRQKQLKTALAKDEERLRKRLSSFYSTESKRLEKEIASYFSQYGEDNVIEYRKMMESLSDSDRNLLFEKYEKFVEQYPEYTHLMPVRESIYKLDRLQGLQYSVQLQQLKLGAKEIDIVKDHLTKNGLRALAASQEAIGVGTNFLAMNENIVKQFVDVPWANNQKFSDTIWKNKEKLTNYLNTDLAQGFARGDSYDRIVKRMTERFEKVSKNDAFRLVYTEGTFVMNEAAMQPFTSDFEYYKIATVEDNKVCPICAAMQRESEALVAIDSPFEISNRTPGENFPPFHPWCRCSFEIVVEDWDQWMDDYVAKHGGDRETADKIQERLTTEEVKEALEANTDTLTTRAEAEKLLTSDDIGFKLIEDSFKAVDDDLVVSNTLRLKDLESKYGAIHKSIDPSISGMNNGTRTVAFTSNSKTNIAKQKLSLCQSHYKSKDFLEKSELKDLSSGYSMPFKKEYASTYTVTHEYGHMLQNTLIADSVDEFDKFVSKATTRDGKVKAYVRQQDNVAKEHYTEIVEIAKQNDPTFTLVDNISKYGKANYYEFFAESFANAHCGEPNALGKAMLQWLKGKGYYK